MFVRESAQINKTSNLPNGVTRFIEYDRRLKNPKPVICFGVSVAVNGEHTVRKFRVSANVTENHTKNTAIDFRKYYEECVTTGTKFDFNKFDNWNK